MIDLTANPHPMKTAPGGWKTASGSCGLNPDKHAYRIDPHALQPRMESWPAATTTPSGVSVYGFRYYDPEMGRWLGRDPIGERGGVNLFEMIGNDGVGRIDYLGLCWQINQPLSGSRGSYSGTFWYSNSQGASLEELRSLVPGSAAAKSKLAFKDGNRTVDATPYLQALEDELRTKVVEVSEQFKKREIRFGDPAFPPPSYNEAQLNAFFDENYPSGNLPICDCFQALHVVMARAVQQSLLPGGLFTELKYQTAYFYRGEKLMELQKGVVTGTNSVLKGDWGYIHGYEVQQKGKWVPGNANPAYPGENVISLGGNLYYGFIPGGGETLSPDEWREILTEGGTSAGAGDTTRFGRGGDVYFPKVPKIVTDAFNHLKSKQQK